MSILSEILSSKVRAEVFRLLFGLNDNALHVREIERRSGFTIGTIQTEMKKLYRLDLVSKRRDGNRLYYSANQQHPLFLEIQALVVKTVGLLYILKGALDRQKEIRMAFVFGSLADGSEKAGSDIDLMVIGDIGLRSLTRLLVGLTETLGREINPYVLTTEEFSHRKSENEHFLNQVLKDSKLFIIGDEDDLKTMV
ncbi:MAG: nucleotidyltransferase domain-containing protein [Deltaproteobacteria bacterium]|nr:nucleotidyltransferase domain-containing protein [Deltaproteobacteria bacterium]